MAREGPRIVYRRNPPILGKRPLGPKTQDSVTGFYSYQAYMVPNDFGELVDQRGEGLDYRDTQPNVALAPGDLPTSQPNNSSVPWYGMK